MQMDVATAIAAISALFSAIFAGIGLWTAFKATSAAQLSATHALEAETRVLIRELVSAAQRGLSEVDRVDALVVTLSSDYKTLYALSGRDVVSATPLIRTVETKQADLRASCVDVREIIENPRKLINASREDLNVALVRFEAFQVRASMIREQLEHELTGVSSQIKPLRTSALKN